MSDDFPEPSVPIKHAIAFTMTTELDGGVYKAYLKQTGGITLEAGNEAKTSAQLKELTKKLMDSGDKSSADDADAILVAAINARLYQTNKKAKKIFEELCQEGVKAILSEIGEGAGETLHLGKKSELMAERTERIAADHYAKTDLVTKYFNERK